MMIKNRISLFLVTFLIIGFFFLALPEKGFSGTGMTPIGCCQFTKPIECNNLFTEGEVLECGIEEGTILLGEVCMDDTECSSPATNVPTLSEWGLIAMAGVLGIVGFMVIRRRKVAA